LNLENEQLKKLLDIQDFQNVNLDELRADAMRLAQETNSIGRVWNRMQPDDFEALGGIGYTYEKRLYDAGICTYRALAEATVEQLRQICKPPAFRVPICRMIAAKAAGEGVRLQQPAPGYWLLAAITGVIVAIIRRSSLSCSAA
jgi:predicted flap endonuclease-1-like 5' DNA nuclease